MIKHLYSETSQQHCKITSGNFFFLRNSFHVFTVKSLPYIVKRLLNGKKYFTALHISDFLLHVEQMSNVLFFSWYSQRNMKDNKYWFANIACLVGYQIRLIGLQQGPRLAHHIVPDKTLQLIIEELHQLITCWIGSIPCQGCIASITVASKL